MVAHSEVVSDLSNARPYALLAEITYRCPLHCPYCSNPIAVHNRNLEGGFPVTPGKTGLQELAPPCNAELSTDEWKRVIRDAADLGILQIGFSGGEPLARRDLPDLIRAAREANLYSNLITSGIGLDDDGLCARNRDSSQSAASRQNRHLLCAPGLLRKQAQTVP